MERRAPCRPLHSLLLLSGQVLPLRKLGKCHYLTAALGGTESEQDSGCSSPPWRAGQSSAACSQPSQLSEVWELTRG